MGKKNVIRKTRKMIAFLLAAAMCVGFCTGFTANAQEARGGTSQQTESKSRMDRQDRVKKRNWPGTMCRREM